MQSADMAISKIAFCRFEPYIEHQGVCSLTAKALACEAREVGSIPILHPSTVSETESHYASNVGIGVQVLYGVPSRHSSMAESVFCKH